MSGRLSAISGLEVPSANGNGDWPDSARLDVLTRGALEQELSAHIGAAMAHEVAREAFHSLPPRASAIPERGGFVTGTVFGVLSRFVGVHRALEISDTLTGRDSLVSIKPLSCSMRPTLTKGDDVVPDEEASGTHRLGESWIEDLAGERFRLEEQVGCGRYGALYKGRAQSHDRPVAVKLYRAPLRCSRGEFSRAIHEECVRLRPLRSVHSLRCIGWGQTPSRQTFVVTEWLDGLTLAARLEQRGSMPLRHGLLLAEQLCRSLVEAHAHGIVHGALGPGSVFLVRGPGATQVKLMDHDRRRIAEAHGECPSESRHSAGWANYLAPEQISGGESDVRSDIYALGALLYRTLTGRVPYEGSTGIAVLMAQQEGLPSLDALDPGAPEFERVRQVLQGCLSLDPQGRHLSAQALLDLLTH